jgi:hypothetical protein
VDSATDWAAVASGTNHILALKTDGTLFAAGLNTSGQLGTGNTTTSASAFLQIGSSTWNKIAVSVNTSAAIRSDGTLHTWGEALLGRLGNGTASGNVLSPTQVGSINTWADIDGGAGHFVGRLTSGAIYAWGQNGDGRTGQGTTTGNTTAPAQIGSSTDNAKIKAGQDNGDGTTWVQKTSGALWGCGYGTFSMLNGVATTSTLTLTSSATDWTDFCPTSQGCLAAKGTELYHCGAAADAAKTADGVFSKIATFPAPFKMASGPGFWMVWY